MSPTAYVAIATELGEEREVLKSLKEIPGVKNAAAVYGAVDVIAAVYEPTMEKLKETITRKVGKIDKVRETRTFIVVEGESSSFSRNEKGEIEKLKL